ncbi:MAG: hypothetical protein JWN48_5605 [Myxococcaceae bacterium]|nr:hypothetical protein [Myxococcaceae bacterium]
MQEKFERICMQDYRAAVTEALASMRAGEFFLAHEQFEALFRGAVGDPRSAFRALTQLAAAHHQLSLGRGRAAFRTWHKARLELERLGLLAPAFDAAMTRFYAGLGIDAEGPRFLDPARLAPAHSFPSFEAATLQKPGP